MEASREGTTLKLDPKVQELYSRLEDERKKNRQLEKQNAQLIAKVNQLESKKAQSIKLEKKKTTEEISLQEKLKNQVQEKNIRDKMLLTKQKRIEHLLESLDDQEEIQELDTNTIEELKTAVDTLLISRNKRTRLIKDLNQQNKELADENEDLLFTRDKLAHDLRSLMSSILSTLSLLDLDEPELVKQLVPSLQAKCNVFMDLVITINENKIEKSTFYINDIVELLNLKPEENDGEIDVEVTGYDIPILADKAAFYDILQNLINNSIKYSGKEINNLRISFEISQEEDLTVLKFSDNGIGIPEGKSKNIFDLYNRAGIDDGKGRGIGLFMAQKMISNHNGSIEYVTEYTNGAQFKISVPKSPDI